VTPFGAGQRPPGRALHAPLLALAGLALVAGLWAGLVRLGWRLPALPLALPAHHGALMISGFFGTLVSLERALALRQHGRQYAPAYAAPLLAALSALALLAGLPPWVGRGLGVLAAAGLVSIFGLILRRQWTDAHVVMGLGALLWLGGSLAWLAGASVARAVPWWAGFLIITIAGERLELGRVLLHRRRTQRTFYLATGVTLAGLLLSLAVFDWGVRLAGLGLAGLGLWLLRFDVARRTIRLTGLTRYMAASLLPGYAWLAFGGGLWAAVGGRYTAGPLYDALLHSLLIGFVLSMIFAHAPIILPAVMGVPVPYHPALYGPLALLHGSLALRVAGDLAGLPALRAWGGLLNEAALLVFLAGMAAATVRARRQAVRAAA
jgi:hypothetical protein